LNAKERQHEQIQTIRNSREDVPIDRVLRELGLQHPEQIQNQCEHERRKQQTQVRFQITKQTLGNRPVVRFADGFFFVEFLDGG
jgi:hypothetical protein